MFKSVKTYNEEKFGGLFLLRNDGDYADVIFLYPSIDDVLVAETHYIKSADYSGYVHCCGKGCPACAKGIRVQTKLFIPLYNLTTNQVEFWDRSIRFEPQLSQDVNTIYHITAVGKNSIFPYEDILKANNIVFPAYYENICREMSIKQLADTLTASVGSADTTSYDTTSTMPNYQVTPRTATPGPSNIAPPSIDDVEPDTLDGDDINF